LNINLLKSGAQEFIENNLKTDILSVVLKSSPFPDISAQELAQQLKGKQISQHKFPTLFKTPGILYPKKLHLEQASSEATALYKSDLVHGKILLDLTGGMGIDSMFFARHFDRVICCEKNEELAQITRYNMEQMELEHVEVIQGDGLDYLKSASTFFDCIYLDPARRTEGKKRVALQDYEPDILENLDLLMNSGKTLMLKTSPLMDIDAGMVQLRNVSECHVLAVRNEVKELLWILMPGFKDEAQRKAVNIKDSEHDTFQFTWEEERTTAIEYHAPLAYLYEPNAAILKSGGFKSVTRRYPVLKIAPSSHLYTSKEKVDFPGRRFQILEIQAFSRNWNKKGAIKKANITTRNFGISVAELRKRFRIKDGGDAYWFFTTLSDGKKVAIHCVKD